MEYNAANQLVSLNNQAWQHDEDGNVVVRRVGSETWLLGYDAEGQLGAFAEARRRGWLGSTSMTV
jgi:hypothetical protein